MIHSIINVTFTDNQLVIGRCLYFMSTHNSNLRLKKERNSVTPSANYLNSLIGLYMFLWDLCHHMIDIQDVIGLAA